MSSVCEAEGSARVDLKRNSLSLPCCLVNRECSWKKTQSEEKNRNQSSDLLCRSMDWFLYDRDLPHERPPCCPQNGQIYLNLVDTRR